MNNQTPLRIVVFKEEDKFVAQCVDFDICTQADDIETLKDRMDCLIEVELCHASESGQAVDPAPKRFHKMWDQQGTHAYKEVAA
jgi:predicted RNase H-like HicB family nuclease